MPVGLVDPPGDLEPVAPADSRGFGIRWWWPTAWSSHGRPRRPRGRADARRTPGSRCSRGDGGPAGAVPILPGHVWTHQSRSNTRAGLICSGIACPAESRSSSPIGVPRSSTENSSAAASMIAEMWSVTASRSVASSSRSTRLTAESIASSRSVLRSSLHVGEFDRPGVAKSRSNGSISGRPGRYQSEFEAVSPFAGHQEASHACSGGGDRSVRYPAAYRIGRAVLYSNQQKSACNPSGSRRSRIAHSWNSPP